VTTFNSLEEGMDRELTCRSLPLAVKFFVTRHSTFNHSVNFGIFVPVGIIIIIRDASGSIDVLKKFSHLLC
jgi:hypothetical protein